MPVYHLTHGNATWSYYHRYSAPAIIVNPPEYVVRKLDSKLDKLDDEEGRIPEDILTRIAYTDLRKIAAKADTDEVNGNSSKADIVDALGTTEESDVADKLDAVDDSSFEAGVQEAVRSVGERADGVEREKEAIREAMQADGHDVADGSED